MTSSSSSQLQHTTQHADQYWLHAVSCTALVGVLAGKVHKSEEHAAASLKALSDNSGHPKQVQNSSNYTMNTKPHNCCNSTPEQHPCCPDLWQLLPCCCCSCCAGLQRWWQLLCLVAAWGRLQAPQHLQEGNCVWQLVQEPWAACRARSHDHTTTNTMISDTRVLGRLISICSGTACRLCCHALIGEAFNAQTAANKQGSDKAHGGMSARQGAAPPSKRCQCFKGAATASPMPL